MQSLRFMFFFCMYNFFVFNFLTSTTFEHQKKVSMIRDLNVIKHHYETGYAPADWKKEFSGWDIEKAFLQAKKKILSSPTITTKQFQMILRDFIKSMKDYHVDVSFFSTESASLPFTIKGAEGRYFIDWIDPIRLPPSHYSIRISDELLQFDGRPIDEVVKELKEEYGKFASPNTDQSFAEMKVTLRLGMQGDVVPRGSVIIKTQSTATGKINSCQLFWTHTPEYVKNPLDFIPAMNFISCLIPQCIENKLEIPQILMANPAHKTYLEKFGPRNGGLGSDKSYIPMLGEPLWMKEEEDNDHENLLDGTNIKWHAYVYKHPSGKEIGYVRIPHYMGFSPQAREFGEIIKIMEEKTDALVIDQIRNFGGYVSFQYALASMLAIEPLITPFHRMKITQKEALEAHKNLEFIRIIELMLGSEKKDNESRITQNDKNEEEIQPDDEEAGQLNYQEILCLKDYYHLVLDEWSKGNTLTRPTPILGIDRINPHPKYQYSKPILMLIDEMDFSGGDFVPAILQDNRRALLFGSRTAGAGGFVFSFEFPNTHGIAFCTYTASIAERPNYKKIENLGVTPDIQYQITVDDLQNNYRGYVEAVNNAVNLLLENQNISSL